jgi:hypothetical protein
MSKSRAVPILLVTLGVVFSFCVAGTVIAMASGAGDTPKPSGNTISVLPLQEQPTAAPATHSVSPRTAVKAKPKVVTLADEDTPGQVGDDFPAGTYRTTASVAGLDCYWMKSSDAEGSNIVDNGLPGGGRPQVTLKKGQWFTSERCGTWQRIK